MLLNIRVIAAVDDAHDPLLHAKLKFSLVFDLWLSVFKCCRLSHALENHTESIAILGAL